jgi:anti-anti-sigma regulatory factor
VSALSTVAVDPLDSGYGERVLLLRVTGRVDDAQDLAQVLAAHTSQVTGALTHVVLDLSGVPAMSLTGARALAGWAARLAGPRRRVLAAAAPATVTNVLYQAQAADVLELFPSVGSALATAGPGQRARTARDDADAEPRGLLDQVRTLPVVARAQGILMERYGLGGEQASALLDETARVFAVPARVLAAAIVETPRPASPAGPWFAGRTPAEPTAEFLWRSGVDPADRGKVLDVLLEEALHITGADGDLQLVDPALGVLVLERRQGFSAEFQDFFAHVGDDGTACATARRSGVRVSVPGVATDPIFAGQASREVVLVVLDALEHLHRLATAH